MQFWPPDDEHMCSKHVEAWNKLIVKQNFCALSWLITEINFLQVHFNFLWAHVPNAIPHASVLQLKLNYVFSIDIIGMVGGGASSIITVSQGLGLCWIGVQLKAEFENLSSKAFSSKLETIKHPT